MQNPMLSPNITPSLPPLPAADSTRQERHLAASPEALLASLIAHLRDKSLNDAQCVQAIRTTLRQLAAY